MKKSAQQAGQSAGTGSSGTSLSDAVSSLGLNKNDGTNAAIGALLGATILGGRGLFIKRDPEDKSTAFGDAVRGALLGGLAGFAIPKGWAAFTGSTTAPKADDAPAGFPTGYSAGDSAVSHVTDGDGNVTHVVPDKVYKVTDDGKFVLDKDGNPVPAINPYIDTKGAVLNPDGSISVNPTWSGAAESTRNWLGLAAGLPGWLRGELYRREDSEFIRRVIDALNSERKITANGQMYTTADIGARGHRHDELYKALSSKEGLAEVLSTTPMRVGKRTGEVKLVPKQVRNPDYDPKHPRRGVPKTITVREGVPVGVAKAPGSAKTLAEHIYSRKPAPTKGGLLALLFPTFRRTAADGSVDIAGTYLRGPSHDPSAGFVEKALRHTRSRGARSAISLGANLTIGKAVELLARRLGVIAPPKEFIYSPAPSAPSAAQPK